MPPDYPNMFFTADVAELLRVPEWRVIKFAMASEYKITPAHGNAAGSGTRRVYDLENVCQIAMVLRLQNAGLSSKTIGLIVEALGEQGQISTKLDLTDKELKDFYLLVFLTSGNGKFPFKGQSAEVSFICDLKGAHERLGQRSRDDALFLYVGWIFRDLKDRLAKWQRRKGK